MCYTIMVVFHLSIQFFFGQSQHLILIRKDGDGKVKLHAS
jgi:hypothetical protein